MGGRGSSSSGGGGGGGISSMNQLKNFSKATESFNPNTVTPPSMQDIAKGNVTPKGGVAFSDFKTMTDDEKADVIAKALMVKPPIFLDDSGLQRLAYFTGMSDKPQIVSDSQLDKMAGKSIYRNVHDSYNSRTDIGYSSKDIYKQIASGDFTMYSDSGGSVHGKAIYFASNYSSASMYMSGKNNIMMRAKISPNAKTISESQLNTLVRQEANKNSKLYRACKNAGSSSNMMIALAKGYDVVTDDRGSGYNMVLNRGALVMSDTTKPTTYGGNW